MVSFGRVDDLKMHNRERRVRFKTLKSTGGVGDIHFKIRDSTTRESATQINSANAADVALPMTVTFCNVPWAKLESDGTRENCRFRRGFVSGRGFASTPGRAREFMMHGLAADRCVDLAPSLAKVSRNGSR
jgi:hypothetical protein